MIEVKICYICPSTRYAEDHHLDCKRGKISPETVPLCRRCHRTYHDLGVSWFDNEYLDKAIEIENRRRQIVSSSLKNQVYPLPLLTREDIRRSDHFNKTHGIKPDKPEPVVKEQVVATERILSFPRASIRPGLDPLPGWDWYWKHYNDPPPPCEMAIYYDGEKVAEVTGNPKRGDVSKIMRSVFDK